MTEAEEAAKIAAYDRDSPDVRIRWENGRIFERDPAMWEIVSLHRQCGRALAQAQAMHAEADAKLEALIAERYLKDGDDQ